MMYLASTLEDDLNLDEVPNKTFIEKLIASFNWEDIVRNIIVASVRILFTLIIFFVVNLIAKWAIDEGFKRFIKREHQGSNRYETIYRVVKNIYQTVFYFFLIYTILEILNFPVSTLLASAGVVGLAVSLGAQDFVSDLVNGFTILSGRQLNIGDEVNINDISGTVINIDLRKTQVKDFDGTMHYIPNREISIISNRSKGDMRALVDVRLYPDTDVNKVRQVIKEVNTKLIANFPEITVPPEEILFVSNDKNQLTMRVIMYTKPGAQYNVMFKFYETYVSELSNAGIDLPYGDINLQ
ncbi:MAG TPA: mechanosensitive ion channel family protein [Candidatus Atopostipes pullistercoris]|uniref:Mechanosensitive ion channel family protein n=1 Tax=Candidatus Atopostipes pullistercoris TaxID=2838467 RepID=A0A9D2G2S0_9LACT|nr:mechanosensitive ion channel family protein [Candidatus Atopostipes pullistercoris]